MQSSRVLKNTLLSVAKDASHRKSNTQVFDFRRKPRCATDKEVLVPQRPGWPRAAAGQEALVPRRPWTTPKDGLVSRKPKEGRERPTHKDVLVSRKPKEGRERLPRRSELRSGTGMYRLRS